MGQVVSVAVSLPWLPYNSNRIGSSRSAYFVPTLTFTPTPIPIPPTIEKTVRSTVNTDINTININMDIHKTQVMSTLTATTNKNKAPSTVCAVQHSPPRANKTHAKRHVDDDHNTNIHIPASSALSSSSGSSSTCDS